MHVSVTDFSSEVAILNGYDNVYPAVAIGALPQPAITFTVEGNQHQDSILQLADRESTGARIKLFDFKIDQLQPKLGIGPGLTPDASLHIYSDGIDPLKIEDGSTNSIGTLMHIDDENNIKFLQMDGKGTQAMSIHTKTNSFTGVVTPHVVIGDTAINGPHNKSTVDGWLGL